MSSALLRLAKITALLGGLGPMGPLTRTIRKEEEEPIGPLLVEHPEPEKPVLNREAQALLVHPFPEPSLDLARMASFDRDIFGRRHPNFECFQSPEQPSKSQLRARKLPPPDPVAQARAMAIRPVETRRQRREREALKRQLAEERKKENP